MISLLLINYRSAPLAAEAIRTARAATTRAMEVVVVDNSLDANEADALRAHADTVLASAANRGYAGGINDGRRACSGEVLVVANPDVTFAPQSIDLLVEQLGRDVAVAGPALFWDEAQQWMLPPSDLHSGWQKLDELLAARSRAWMTARDRRRFAQRVAFWSATAPRDVRALSGAVLAIRSEAFDALGGFDERFPLYFEETDFLRRAAARRMRIRYVPAARVRHLYNQSAGQVAAEAGALYAASEHRYLQKWNGPFAALALHRLARPPLAYAAQPLDGTIRVERDDVVIEASPLASFATAAGHFPRGREVDLPPEVLRTFRGGELYLRAVVRATGEILATYSRCRS